MYLYGPSDRNRLFLLFSYLGLVNCMGKKHHEIVYMKLWPNTNSKLWKCTIWTEFRVYHHSPPHLCCSYPHHPLKLTKEHDCVPSLLAVHLQMLACRVMSHLITTELLFLLSSQGGYTVAYCQKVIRWRRAHTQMVLYFTGAAVPATDLQLPGLWAHVASLVKTSRGWASCWHQFSLGCPWQWRQG